MPDFKRNVEKCGLFFFYNPLAHKDEDGHATQVPDSLRKEFTTKSGRKVLDGAGIEPDFKVKGPKASPILISLAQKQLMFEYATIFRTKHESIALAKEFALTDEDYDQFKEFLKDKDYSYSTETEKLLKKLEKAAEKEKYVTDIESDFKNLENAIFKNKSKDLDIYKDQITRFLESEIVTRYYFQKGQIEQSLVKDEDILEAKKIFSDTNAYNTTLSK